MGFDLIAFWLFDPSSWSVIVQVAIGLGAVIFIHELGHFAVAKACGVKCEKFYLGFDIGGMKLAKFQWGETEYGIGILPLGGYVKMLGQDDNPNQMQAENERARAKSGSPPLDSDIQVSGAPTADVARSDVYDPRSYMAKSVPQRMAIISAGVIMNVIFAFFVGSIAYGLGVKEVPATVSQTVAGDPAWTAGVQAGDEIVRINDVVNPRYRDLQTHVSAANLSKGVELEIRRPGVDAPIVLNIMPDKGATQQLPTIGITSGAELTVAGIEDSSLAKKSGLQNGDKITAIDGKPISSSAEWAAVLANRASERLVVTVQNAVKDKKGDPVIPLRYEELPVAVRLEPQPLRTFGMEMEIGPIVGIQKGSPAEAAGLKRGDILQTIDGEGVGDPLTLDARLRRHAGKSVRLTVKREGASEPVELNATLLEEVGVDAIVRLRGPVEAAALGAAFTVSPRVASVATDGPAQKAGVETGWIVKRVTFEWPNDAARAEQSYIPTNIEFQPADSGNDANWPIVEMGLLTYLAPDVSVRILFENGREVAMTPVESSDSFSTDRGIALAPQTRLRKAVSVGEAIKLGAAETRDALLQVYWFIQKLASGQISWKLIGGPGRIAVAAGSYAKKGFADYLLFLTLISANLAVVNFLPIPLLDGGHMVFLAAEGIRGKPLDERIVLWLTYFGLFFILGLMFLGITLDSIWGLKSFGWIEG